MTDRAPWSTSTRSVPGSWKTMRMRVLRRDRFRCYICGKPGADEVDHIVPLAAGGTHHYGNLAAIHAEPCHRQKTEREKRAGIARRSTRRPPEKHPGLL